MYPATDKQSDRTKVVLIEIWTHGGTAKYAADLSRALDASSGSDAVELIVPKGYQFKGEVAARESLPLLSGGNSRYRGIRMVAYATRWTQQQLAILRVLRSRRPDVVHFLGTTVASRTVIRLARSM